MTGQEDSPRSKSLGLPNASSRSHSERTAGTARLGSSGATELGLCPGCPWLGDDGGGFACEAAPDWNSEIVFPIRDYEMSRPCGRCGHGLGQIDRKRNQDVVTCQGCGRFVYNAPRAETGLPA